MIALDIGNTKTAVGFFHEATLTKTWRIATNRHRLADDYYLILEQFLSSIGESLKNPKKMIVSSVIPSATDEIRKLNDRMDLHIVTAKTPKSYEIAISEPHTLGSDRIADLEAAVQKYEVPVIVVDTGTATTVSVVNRNKHFLGGTISPGVGISTEALYSFAASLSQITLSVPENAIGSTTAQAIRSGVCFGHCALIEGLVKKITHELQEELIQTVVTGGAIDLLAPCLHPDFKVNPNLTLEGLHFLHKNLKREQTR